ncbi:Histone-lysine N-methyltransferase ASHH3, partial [Ananas comosus]
RHKQCSIQQIFEQMLNELSGPVDFDLPCSLKEWKSTHYVPIKRNELRMMAYSVPALHRNQQMAVMKIVIVGKGQFFSFCSFIDCCSLLVHLVANAAVTVPINHSVQSSKENDGGEEKCGFGLVADEGIKQERLWNMKGRGNTNFYLCEVSHDMVIDATNKGNKSRFINHSCEPNTEMQKWRVCGETRVGIFALRDIQRGEEVTYDYKYANLSE